MKMSQSQGLPRSRARAASRLFRSTATLVTLSMTLSGCGFLHNRLYGAGPEQPPAASAEGGPPAVWAGAAAADEPTAALVARSILAAGGNAADAATALAFTLMVTLPSRASLGGGGACLAFSPSVKPGKKEGPTAFVFVSPAAAGGGSRPAAVPMTARGLLLMQAVYGLKPIDQLIGPAQRLAALGTPVSQAFESDLAVVSGPLFGDPLARATFGDAAGAPLGVGATMTQPDLAATLDQLRLRGVTDLYQGQLAQRLVDGSLQAGGPISAADLTAAVPTQTMPLERPLGGTKVAFLPPPADGGIAAEGAFNILRDNENDLGGAQATALGIATAWRHGMSAGDPEALLKDRNLPQGNLPQLAASTSFVTADQYGGGVACTLTMNNLFGTGRIAPGTGILLAASPAHAQVPLLSAALVWNRPLNAFRAAVAASGQEGAPLAVAVATDNALRHGGRDIGQPVPEPGRANAIGCPDFIPGSFKTCLWVTDPRGAGIATGRN
jgi:gamma-glutamyltranspeptidase / glutathione hydrolase